MIITAKEARAIVIKRQNERPLQELRDIEEWIKERAEEGKTELIIKGSINRENNIFLKKSGYNVFLDYNGDTRIRW